MSCIEETGGAPDRGYEIDRVLADHYGFTDEELDFIINYDIKYRMGPVFSAVAGKGDG